MDLTRITRRQVTVTVPAELGSLEAVSLAVLPIRRGPSGLTVWLPATSYNAGTRAAAITVAGADADQTDALAVPAAGGDLWAADLTNPDVDAVFVERISVTDGGASGVTPDLLTEVSARVAEATAARVVDAEVRADDLFVVLASGDEIDAGNVRGPQGVQGVQGPVGPVGIDWKGTWSGSTSYDQNDAVYFNGSTWYAGQNVPANVAPADVGGNPWYPLAVQGVQGIQGIQGPKGDQGNVGPTGPAPVWTTTSSTTRTISLVGHTLTVGTGLDLAIGQYVRVSQTANAANYMAGPITAYDPVTGSMSFTAQESSGAGSISGWTITVGSGPKGAKGDTGDLTPSDASTASGAVSLAGPSFTPPVTRVLTLSGNVTLNLNPSLSASQAGTTTVVWKQAASGGPFTLTHTSTAIEWAGDAAAPTMPSVANSELVISYFWTGQACRAVVVGIFFP